MAAEGDDVAGVGMVNNNNSAISVKTETSSNTSGSMSRKKPLSSVSLSNGLAGTSHHINGHGSRDGLPPPPPPSGNNNHNKQHIPPPPQHHMGKFCVRYIYIFGLCKSNFGFLGLFGCSSALFSI